MPLFGKGSDEEKEGIYVYKGGGEWEKVEALPPVDRPVLVYFSNLKCPFCKVFDVVWDVLVDDPKLRSRNLVFVKVVCSFFESNCKNPKSKKLFREYKVDRSPLLMLFLPGGGGEPLRKELLPSEYAYDYKRVRDAILRELGNSQ